MDRHLDDVALRALEAKDAQAVAHFRAHLAQPCPECEAFLAEAPARLWWLEAEADRLLHLHGSLHLSAPDTSGFHAVRRAMRARRMRKALAASLAGALAVAAALVLFVAVPRPARPYAEVKGQELGLLELSAVTVSRAGATAPVAPGAPARESDTLVLRYRAERSGPAFLLEAGADGKPRALGEFALSAGTHDLADSGGVSGVSLEGERGEVCLWLVQSPGPLTAAKAVEAVEQGTAAPGMSVAGFTVRVVPGEN